MTMVVAAILVRIESAELQHVELLEPVDLGLEAPGPGFECLPEAELDVVDQTDAGRDEGRVGQLV